MDRSEIKEIIQITIEEMLGKNNRELENIRFNIQKKEVEKRLREYFAGRGDGNNISYAMKLLEHDRYIGILYMQYKEGKTVERIAEIMGKEARTIFKNKKRLIKEVYKIINA